METSGFFDANVVNNTYDRVYLSAQFSNYFSKFIGNGVFGGILSNELKVTNLITGGMFVSVSPGMAFIRGYWYQNSPTNLTIPISSSDGVLDRIDNIVVRWSLSERQSKIVVVEGEYSSTPIPPNVERNDAIYDLKIAEVYVRHGTLNILSGDITDTRGMQDVCGFASIKPQLVNTHQNETFHLEQFADFEPGLEPTKMTKVIRDAVDYAYLNGYHTLTFPPNSSITVGLDSSTGGTTANAGIAITLPENLGIDLNGSTLRLSPNEYTKKEYRLVKLQGNNSFIRNGKLYGDYAVPDATHQWGHGIFVTGQNAKVEDIEIENFMGDGIYLHEDSDNILIRVSNKNSWQAGTNYIETIDYISLTNSTSAKEVQLRFSASKFNYSPFCDITFYDTDYGVIKTIRTCIGMDIILPAGAKYCKAKIYSNEPNKFFESSVAYNETYIWETLSPNHSISVKNVFIHKIGRNGITLGNAHNACISDFVIYDIQGTSPMAGIDIEEGREQCYQNVIQRGFISKCNNAINFSSGNKVYINTVYETENICGFYGATSSGFSVDNCVINDGIEIGKDFFIGTSNNNSISNSSISNNVIAKGTNFSNCYFYQNAKLEISDYSICKDSVIYSDQAGLNIALCGGFESCYFVNGAYTYDIDYSRLTVDNTTTYFLNCTFKSVNRIDFRKSKIGGSIKPIEHITGCSIESIRVDGITAKKIVNTEIKGLWFYNGSTFSQMQIVAELITGCYFERYLNELNRGISEYGLGIIWITKPAYNAAWIPDAIVITNNVFMGMLSKTEAVATIDYAVKVASSDNKMPIYINNNYSVQREFGNTFTLQLTVLKDTSGGSAVINTDNNYGFKTT